MPSPPYPWGSIAFSFAILWAGFGLGFWQAVRLHRAKQAVRLHRAKQEREDARVAAEAAKDHNRQPWTNGSDRSYSEDPRVGTPCLILPPVPRRFEVPADRIQATIMLWDDSERLRTHQADWVLWDFISSFCPEVRDGVWTIEAPGSRDSHSSCGIVFSGRISNPLRLFIVEVLP
jgi:hypothetical protein